MDFEPSCNSPDSNAIPNSPDVDPALGETGGSEGLQRIDGESQLDWDSIIVSDVLDDEGRVQVPCENEIYFNLGLNKEDEAANNRFSGSGTNCHAQGSLDTDNEDHHADQPCQDYIPDGKRVVYNRMNPSM